MKQYQWPIWSRSLPEYDIDATTGLLDVPEIGAVQLKKIGDVLVRDLHAFCDGTRHQFAILRECPHVRTLRLNQTWSLWTAVVDQSDDIKRYSNIMLGEL